MKFIFYFTILAYLYQVDKTLIILTWVYQKNKILVILA